MPGFTTGMNTRSLSLPRPPRIITRPLCRSTQQPCCGGLVSGGLVPMRPRTTSDAGPEQRGASLGYETNTNSSGTNLGRARRQGPRSPDEWRAEARRGEAQDGPNKCAGRELPNAGSGNLRRGGRVVECAGFEIRYTGLPYRGFESLPLRQPQEPEYKPTPPEECAAQAFTGGI